MVRTKPGLIVLFSLCLFTLNAQEIPPTRPSPTAIAAVRYKDTYVKITYCQPRKRGREIFGKLVPFGDVWRTGANEATEITLTKDLFIKGTLLLAGTYSLFTIPGKESWTIILNKDVGQWGAYNYNIKLDVLRMDVPAQQTDTVFESFTIQFDHRNSVADLLLQWDKTKIIIPIQFIEPKP
jgi:Protein of unknown function (DUF2911)